MVSSDFEPTDKPDAAPAAPSAEEAAEQAAAGLKDQIAALRRQVKDAQKVLRGDAESSEPRSFKP